MNTMYLNVQDGLDWKTGNFRDKVFQLTNRSIPLSSAYDNSITNGVQSFSLERKRFEEKLGRILGNPIDWSEYFALYKFHQNDQKFGHMIAESLLEKGVETLTVFTGSPSIDILRNYGVSITNAPTMDIVTHANSKLLVAELGGDLAGSIANIALSDNQKLFDLFLTFGEDVFIKKPLDAGSNGVKRVRTESELLETTHERKGQGIDTIIMQKTVDDGVNDFADTCNVYLDIGADGTIQEIYPGPLMQEKKGIEHVGNKTYGISVEDSHNLMRMGKGIAKKLRETTGYYGPAGFNFVKSEGGRVYMEVNARLNGSTMLTQPMHDFDLIGKVDGISKPLLVKNIDESYIFNQLNRLGILFNGSLGVLPLYPSGSNFVFSIYGNPDQISYYENLINNNL